MHVKGREVVAHELRAAVDVICRADSGGAERVACEEGRQQRGADGERWTGTASARQTNVAAPQQNLKLIEVMLWLVCQLHQVPCDNSPKRSQETASSLKPSSVSSWYSAPLYLKMVEKWLFLQFEHDS